MLEELAVLHQSDKSTVTLVLDTETNRHMVEKLLTGQHPLYQRIETLHHPYLPRIYLADQEPDRMVVLEEYIEGVNLRRAALSERALTRALLELCDVLQYLHSQGILHRDIKPENILLAGDGHIRLIDFDAAREPKTGGTQDTHLLGTRGYAPPEQYGFSQTDCRADLYALGATFQELLGPISRKRRWKRILRKCTAMDPTDRYRSAGQIKRAVYRGRLYRWLIRPILTVCLLLVLLFTATLLVDSGPRSALMGLFSLSNTETWKRDTIDLQILQEAVENGTAPLMYTYQGQEAVKRYELLQTQYPDLMILYSGYMTLDGALVYAGVETTYLIQYGVHTMGGLSWIAKVYGDGSIEELTVEQYEENAPAVMTLYERILELPTIDPNS